jgi:hypothetical protein
MYNILMGLTPMSGQTVRFSTALTIFRKGSEVMSAITETKPGGEMVCLLEFSAQPRDLDNNPVAGERRQFRIGEHVRFRGFYFKATPEDNPTGYMAVFEPMERHDSKCYAARETFFVTVECWEDLGKHFASIAARKKPSDLTRTSAPRASANDQ